MTHIKRIKTQPTLGFVRVKAVQYLVQTVGQSGIQINIDVYFCDPRSPWQRGSNENTNGLLRQYFPDGTDLSLHSQAALNKVALRLNQRPGKTLAFMTPADKLSEALR